jgi:hypothetical protein
MKPFDYYSKPQTLYPNKRDYITVYVYDKGVCIHESDNYTKSILKEKYPNAVIQEVLDDEAYKAQRKQYDEEKFNLYVQFQNDLFENFNVTDNPKRSKCFELAWEKGHSNGLEEVYNEFYDLVELIQD